MKTQLKMSKIVAGVMRWGSWGAQFNKSTYQAMIEHCLEKGVTTFDHADIYGGFTTEVEFGMALKEMNIDRSNLQLVTKCGIKMMSENRPNNKIKSYNTRYQYIIDSVDQSLSNFQTEYIDLLLIHRPSPLMDPEEIARAIQDLKGQGKIKHFGVSNFTRSQFELLNEYATIESNQIEASLLHLDPFVDGSIDQLYLKQCNIMAWSPIGGKKYLEPESSKTSESIQRLKAIQDKYGWSYSEMAYLFLMHHPSNIFPIVGSSKKARITEAINCIDLKITDEQWFEIWIASTGVDVA